MPTLPKSVQPAGPKIKHAPASNPFTRPGYLRLGWQPAGTLTLSRNCREGLRAEVVTGSGEASRRRRAATLRGRGSEVSALGRIVEAVRAGESRVLVIRGEPGVGKTALL